VITPEDLAPLPITGNKTIPEDYLDEMGHMNVMWYTHLFSNATGKMFDLFGLSDDYCIRTNSGAFALECHLRYLAEVRVGKTVRIHSRLVGRSEKRWHFMHFMVIEEDGRIAATAEFVGAHIDMTRRRTSPIPPIITEPFDAILAHHDQLDWDPPLCGIIRP